MTTPVLYLLYRVHSVLNMNLMEHLVKIGCGWVGVYILFPPPPPQPDKTWLSVTGIELMLVHPFICPYVTSCVLCKVSTVMAS